MICGAHNTKHPDRVLRNARVDLFRGVALICIFIDHVAGNPLRHFTLRNFGFCDAAEMFVLLAGVSAAWAYGSGRRYRKLARRVLLIYVAQVALVIVSGITLIALSHMTGSATLARMPLVAAFQAAPWTTAWRTALLLYQPEFFDILPLYVLLLGVLPLILFAAERSAPMTLLASVALWLAANAFALNLPGDREGGWYFNPLAWQLVFTIGVLLGLRRHTSPRLIPHSRFLLFAAAAYLLFALIAQAPWTHLHIPALQNLVLLPTNLVADNDKTFEAAWRLIDILALVYAAAYLIPERTRWLKSPPALLLARIGRRSLTMFVLASFASTVSTGIVLAYGGSLPIEALVNIVGFAVIFAVARHDKIAATRPQEPLPLRP